MLRKKRDRGSQVKGLREIVLIHDLRGQGLSISAIARKVGSDRKIVRKYLDMGLEAPCYGPRPLQGSLLNPYRDYLTERVRAFPDLSGRRLLREIKSMGYEGSYSTLKSVSARGAASPARTLCSAVLNTSWQAGAVRFCRVQGCSSQMSLGLCGKSGCSAWFWVIHAGSGAGSSPVTTCRPWCAVTLPLSTRWVARRKRSSMTG